MSIDQVVREAMALPAEERAKLAEQLLGSLAPPDQGEIDSAWVDEIERRIGEYEKGKVQSIPADAVMREARERAERK